MIISNSRRYIFVHVNKAAGTSIRQHLAQHGTDSTDGVVELGTPEQQEYCRSRGLTKHDKAIRIRRLIGAELFGRFWKFAAARNPWERAVSWYLYLRETRLGIPEMNVAAEAAFSDFIRDPFVQERMSRNTVCAYIRDHERSTDIIDFVLRVECLDDDFRYVCRQVDIPPSEAKLPELNSSARRDHRKMYAGSDDVEIIGSIFAEDVMRFRYTFEP